MPHKLSEPLSEEELAEIAGWWEIWDSLNERERRGKMKYALEVASQDIPRLIATIRHLQETLNGVVDIVLKEADHD